MDNERLERLVEIKDEMLELLNETRRLLQGTSEEDRARSYWWAHIRMAIDNDHGYLGGSMVTIQDTIEELENEVNGNQDEEEAT